MIRWTPTRAPGQIERQSLWIMTLICSARCHTNDATAYKVSLFVKFGRSKELKNAGLSEFGLFGVVRTRAR